LTKGATYSTYKIGEHLNFVSSGITYWFGCRKLETDGILSRLCMQQKLDTNTRVSVISGSLVVMPLKLSAELITLAQKV
jgi:hypothetical protein